MYRKILAGLLAAMFVLAGCAQSGTDVETGTGTAAAPDTTAAPETTTADPNDRSQVKDGVPDDLKFDGETLRILFRGVETGNGSIERYDVRGTDNIGEAVSDSVWLRNQSVEDRLDITLQIQGSGTGSLDAERGFMKQLVMAGSDEFDYVNTTGNASVTQSLNTYLHDLSNLPYVDYDAKWWWRDAIEAVSLDGETYNYIFGDMLIYCYIQTGVVYYNKTLYENVFGNGDEMYEYVMNGTWDLDCMREKVQETYSDANGNGTEDKGDIFGLLMCTNDIRNQLQHFVEGCDLQMYRYDENDQLVIDFDQERTVLVIEKFIDLIHNTTGVFDSDKGIDDSADYFAEGSILYLPARFARVLAANMRDMEDAYGILPYPKLNEEQENYSSLSHNSGTTICLLKTVPEKRLNLIGAALEALCAESYRSVMPKFLDTALKLKYSHDSMSGQVVDIVIASVTKNTLHEYETYTASIHKTCITDPIQSGKNNFASAYAKVAPAAQNTWNKSVQNLTK